MKFPATPEDWTQFLAENNARLVRRTDPVSGEQSVIIKRQRKLGRHLFDAKTRDYVVNLLLERYGLVEAF